jgi:hypothetical protein
MQPLAFSKKEKGKKLLKTNLTLFRKSVVLAPYHCSPDDRFVVLSPGLALFLITG